MPPRPTSRFPFRGHALVRAVDALYAVGQGEGMSVRLPDMDQWLEAVAPVAGVDIPAARRAGVKANLKTAAKMAALLEKVPLRDETEPAPVYRA